MRLARSGGQLVAARAVAGPGRRRLTVDAAVQPHVSFSPKTKTPEEVAPASSHLLNHESTFNSVVDSAQRSVQPGECIGVVGANASGKRAVLLRFAEEARRAKKRVEIVDFQSHRRLLRDVGDEIVARALGGLKDNADVVVRLGLTNVWWRRVGSLSTGEGRRVLLARALVKDPDLLILDRPFDGLDLKGRATLMSLLMDISKRPDQRSKSAARPLVQGIKWKERALPSIVVATHRPATELPVSTRRVLLLENQPYSTEPQPRRVSEVQREAIATASPATVGYVRSGPASSALSSDLTAEEFNSIWFRETGPSFAPPERAAASNEDVHAPLLQILNVTVFPPKSTRDLSLPNQPEPRPLLDRVSWTINKRELWWVEGPNGASKSLLLNCALSPTALFELASGQHRNRKWTVEEDVEADRRRKRPPVLKATTAVGLVSTELHVALLERDEQRQADEPPTLVRDLIPLADLADLDRLLRISPTLDAAKALGETPFAQLSQGQQKLVLFARAISARPQLFVLDELCQSLDAFHRARVADVVDLMTTSPRFDSSVVFVTHHKDELPRSVTHRLVLDSGRIVSRGPWNGGGSLTV